MPEQRGWEPRAQPDTRGGISFLSPWDIATTTSAPSSTRPPAHTNSTRIGGSASVQHWFRAPGRSLQLAPPRSCAHPSHSGQEREHEAPLGFQRKWDCLLPNPRGIGSPQMGKRFRIWQPTRHNKWFPSAAHPTGPGSSSSILTLHTKATVHIKYQLSQCNSHVYNQKGCFLPQENSQSLLWLSTQY